MENVVQMPNSLERLAAKINAEHDAFCSEISDSVKHAITAGELLIEAKSKVRHGEWLPWIAANCLFSQRTAYLYASVAKNKAAVEGQTCNGIASLNEVITLLKKLGTVGQDSGSPSEPAKQKRERRSVNKVEAVAENLRAATGEIPDRDTLAQAAHVSPRSADNAIRAVKAADDARVEVDEAALAEAALAALPKTTKEKFELALKHALKQLEQDFEERVRQRSQENDEKLWKPYYDEKLKLAETVVAGRNGVFTKAEYNKILFACHSDHVAKLGPETVRQHDEAFILFRDAEIKLVDEDQSPQMGPRPWTLEELDQRKATVKAERAARRSERVERR